MPSKMKASKVQIKRIVSVTPIMTGRDQESTMFLLIAESDDGKLWYSYKTPSSNGSVWQPFILPKYPDLQ